MKKKETTKFYFAETQYINSFIKAEPLKAQTLASAKREASMKRSFIGTFLYIGNSVNEDGFILEPVAVRKAEGWIDFDLDC